MDLPAIQSCWHGLRAAHLGDSGKAQVDQVRKDQMAADLLHLK